MPGLNVAMSILSAALGACIGSFLNVVIYRLPRGLSVAEPRRSFCPNCLSMIAGYDNVPIFSYLILRGRCRKCETTIALQYPLVEALTALLFVFTYDMFVVGHWRFGVGAWPQDGAIIAAHWALWAGLLATAVMDIEAYHVDIRVTWAVAAVGVLCHMLWTPASSAAWIRSGPLLSAGVLAASAVLAVTAVVAWFIAARRPEPEEGAPETQPAAAEPTAEAVAPVETNPATEAPAAEIGPGPVPETPAEASPPAEAAPPKAASPAAGVAVGLVGLACVVGYVVWMNTASASGPHGSSPGVSAFARLGAVVAVLMLATIAASSAPRAADDEIMEAIEAESVSARGLAIREAAWLAPAVIAGVLAIVWVSRGGATGVARMDAALAWSPFGQWRPLLGLSSGLAGFLLAGALGWGVRILFTIVLGKEALGVGDIHILAAAGAVTGWPVVVLGFFIAAPLALVGVLIFSLRRSFHAIQYGPWLALGLLAAAAAQDWILDALRIGWLLR